MNQKLNQKKKETSAIVKFGGGFILLLILFFIVWKVFNIGEKIEISKLYKTFNLLKEYNPVYKLERDNDISYANVKRRKVLITVPPGLSKKDLEMNIKYAVIETYKTHRPHAISVLAYKKGTNINSIFTAGRCEFAPFGDWARAGETEDLEYFEIKLWFNDEYLGIKPKKKVMAKVDESKLREFFIKLDVNKIGSRTLVLKVKTNFPEGTILLISVGRIYYEINDDATYYGDIYNINHVVKNGIINTKIVSDDSKWYKEYYSKQKQLGKEMFPGIDKNRISKNIEISVLYTPNGQTDKKVLNITGEKAEYIKGIGVKESVSGKTLRIEKEMTVPLYIK